MRLSGVSLRSFGLPLGAFELSLRAFDDDVAQGMWFSPLGRVLARDVLVVRGAWHVWAAQVALRGRPVGGRHLSRLT